MNGVGEISVFPRLSEIWAGLRPVGNSDDWRKLEQMISATDTLESLFGRDEVLQKKRGNLAATMSEIRMAAKFAELGHVVHMLRDSDERFPSSHQSGVSLPDLLVERSDGGQFLVEVRRVDDGDTGFTGLLDRRLVEADLPYCVTPWPLGISLSTPGTDFESRRHHELVAEDVIEQVVARLVHFNENDHTPEHLRVVDMDNCEHTFRIELSEVFEEGARRGYAGGGFTKARIVDEQQYVDHFLRQLTFKADQRDKSAVEAADIPYVVAVDNWCCDLSPVSVATALIGSLCHFRRLNRSLRIHDDRTISQMESTGWGELVSAWKMEPTPPGSSGGPDWSYFIGDSDGAGYSDSAKISAVLVNHKRRWATQWFPNPFARITSRALLEVGFDLDPENWARDENRWWNQSQSPL